MYLQVNLIKIRLGLPYLESYHNFLTYIIILIVNLTKEWFC